MVQPRQQRSYASVVKGLMMALAATVMAGTFMACSFPSPLPLDTPEGINALLNAAPVRSLQEADRWTVYEVPDKLSVQHGFGCLEQGFAATEDYLGFRIQDSATVRRPSFDAGTIILNGWDVGYTDDDHHVAGLGTVIFNVKETLTEYAFTLNWDTGGVLSDKDGLDGYRWCYRYTLVFWNRGAIDAVVPWQTDVATTFVESGRGFADLHGHFLTPPYPGPHAVVPRGLAQTYAENAEEVFDHEVMQVGFDLGPATPDIVGNEITWTSQAVLKDKDEEDGMGAAEFVTVLSGSGVELWQPPTVQHFVGAAWDKESNELDLSPERPSDSCGASEEYFELYRVEDVPFDYAIPVLTGWDLSYGCDDHNVEQIGVYIVEFDYDAASRTLQYTVFSNLRDDSSNGHDARYQVGILGLNGLDKGSEE
jgi:hypothetical protein